jgi:hypothetical protein
MPFRELSIITSKANDSSQNPGIKREDFQMILSSTGLINAMNFVKSAFEDADTIYMVEIGARFKKTKRQ